MIDRIYIENWAKTVNAKSEFAELILRLLHATIPAGRNKMDVPIGSATYLRGWDGWVETDEGTSYIPQGVSGWEFGTEDSPHSKAESDFRKRTDANNSDYNKSETTFVFVTPRIWTKKDEWIKEKKKEGQWKDIVVYDSVIISQWLLAAPAVERWLSAKVGATPTYGFDTVDDKWNDFVGGNKPYRLTPEFYTNGRKDVARQLEDSLKNDIPFAYGIEASSREEALAFILASIQQMTANIQDAFKSKGIVVYDKSVFRHLMNHKGAKLWFVPMVDDYGMVYSAVGNGHSVIIPLSPDDEFTSNKIKLPVSNRRELIDILVSYGEERRVAERVVMENSCNIALIRKALDFPSFRANWQNDEDLMELLPALLMGKWNDVCQGDRDLLMQLSGKDFAEYHTRLVYWSKLPVSPVMNIGTIWRFTSPLSIWNCLSDSIQSKHIELLATAFDEVFVKAEREYSQQLRKGLLENIIMMAMYGSRMGIMKDCQLWVDGLVERLMNTSNPQKWIEFSDNMPLLAEASPSVFVKCIQSAIKDREIVSALFEEKEDLIFTESHHTNMLWALEALAWLPECLQPVTEILLTLSELDPGGKLANRPFNSLNTIYLFWRPQTSASLDMRLAVLEDCIKSGYTKMWDLLVALLPQPHAVSMDTYHLKWRDFEFEEIKSISNKVILDTTNWVITHLMSMFSGDDKRLCDLVEKMEPIPFNIRKILISWLPYAVEKIDGNAGGMTRKALRETLWYQYVDGIKNQFSLTDEELESVKVAYEKLTPSDMRMRYQWLFDEDFPHLPQKIEKDPDDDYSNIHQIEKLRYDACEVLIAQRGVDELIAMRNLVKEPRSLGMAMARFYMRDSLTDKICAMLGNEKDSSFVRGYFGALEKLIGKEALFVLFNSLEEKESSEAALVDLLLSINPDQALWSFVEKQNENIQILYWRKTYGCLYGPYRKDIDYQIYKLVGAGRAIYALSRCWIYADKLETSLLQLILRNVLDSKPDSNGSLDHLAVEKIIDVLHQRLDSDKDLLFQMEWVFLPILVRKSDHSSLSLIYKRMSDDPSFFVELLTYLYRADREDEDVEKSDIVDESKRSNAKRAFQLFCYWRKIPYVSDDGTVDAQSLSRWVQEVLRISSEKKRTKAAYIQLGKMFSYYKEGSESDEKLFAIMENIDNDDFFNNYRVGLYNKRGYTVRGPYDGGEIERGKESFFKNLNMRYKKKFPKVAKVFEKLAKEYSEMSKRMEYEADITKLDY